MGTLFHSCVEVHELIELLVGLLSGVGLDIRVLDGGSGAPREREGFEVFRLHWFHVQCHILCTEMYSTRA